MSNLPQITRVDFTNAERALLTKVFDVAGTFVLSMYGEKGTVEDAMNVKILMDSPAEIAALLVKINRDRVSDKNLSIAENMAERDMKHVRERLQEITNTLLLTKASALIRTGGVMPKIYDDMQWLVNELTKRVMP